MHDMAGAPLISVICNARNGIHSAKASLASLKAQTHQNFELVIAEANGSSGGLLKALRSCRGAYVAFWPAKGRLLPDALKFAADAFAEEPDAGIIAGEGFLVDARDRFQADTDIISLLFTSYRPFLPAAFIRRQALITSGLHDDDWLNDTIDLEICLRLARDFGISSRARKVVECPSHAGTDDGLDGDAENTVKQRLQLLSRTFSAAGFFEGNEGLLLEAEVNQLGILRERFAARGDAAAERLVRSHLDAIARRMHQLLLVDHRLSRNLHRLFCARSHALGALSTPIQKLLGYASRLGGRAEIHIGYHVWNGISFIGRWFTRRMIVSGQPTSDFHPAAPSRAAMFADLYALVASWFEGRGQTALALSMWQRARPPDDADLDSLAGQALLRLPSATNAQIAAFQRAWADRYVGRQAIVSLKTPNVPRVTRKVRVGYHCAFMYSDTTRYMMRNVMRAHDRSRFEVYGYTPKPIADDIRQAFDVVRDTRLEGSRHDAPPDFDVPTICDNDFVSLVRRDEIDVLVELTGFSKGNRFVAMSRRCAPVQVSFMNHTGSSQVPNVDYILSDEIATPSNSPDQTHYSERIWRLPGCFFCFDYRDADCPDVAEPPSATRGHATFGCFGYGGKFNARQIEIWARLLQRAPTAKLHLQNAQLTSHDFQRFMFGQFAGHGVDRDRLILAPGADRRALLETYRDIDVSLDTWPYCGGNTIAESLWMGVPVVTLRGERFSSRYGASLVTAAGCADLVGDTPEQYVEIAAGLAGNLPRLRTLRRRLRQMSVDFGLADSEKFSRQLETAYMEMLARANGV